MIIIPIINIHTDYGVFINWEIGFKYMKMNTLEKLHACLYNEQPELKLSKSVIEKARKPILRMLKLSE